MKLRLITNPFEVRKQDSNAMTKPLNILLVHS